MSGQPTNQKDDPRVSDPDIDWTAYHGQWIALVGDQVAGVGETPEAALLAARHSRPRERIGEVRYVAHAQDH